MDESGGDSSFVEYSNHDGVKQKDRTTSQLNRQEDNEESFQDYSNENIQKSKSQVDTSMQQVAEMEESDFSE